MNRACALIVLLVVVLGGCLSGGSVDSPERSTSPTTSQSVEFPSEPAELTMDSVKAYVESYERAYRKREIHDDYSDSTTTVRTVEISTQNVSVDRRGERAFLVTLRYVVGYTTERDDVAAAADRRFVAKYYINTTTTMRAATAGIDGSGLNPIENGTEVARDHNSAADYSRD